MNNTDNTTFEIIKKLSHQFVQEIMRSDIILKEEEVELITLFLKKELEYRLNLKKEKMNSWVSIKPL